MNTKKHRTNFQHNIKTFRHLNKMSIPEFAELIKVDAKRLSEVEKGRLLPSEYEIKSFLSHFTNTTRERMENSVFELNLSEFAFEKTDPNEKYLKAEYNYILNSQI